jgi:hypothetical protein
MAGTGLGAAGLLAELAQTSSIFSRSLALEGRGNVPGALGGSLDVTGSLPLGMLSKAISSVALDPILIHHCNTP